MSRRPEHLLQRGTTYYFRMPVPEGLRTIVGKREIKRSLGTGNFAKARKLLPVERLKALAELEAARREHDRQFGPPARRVVSLADDELWSLMSRWFVAREREATALRGHDVDVDARLEQIGHLSDLGEGTSALASVYNITGRFLASEGIDLAMSDPSFSKLAALIHEAMLEHEKRMVARFSNGSRVQLNPRFAELGPDTPFAKVRPLTLRVLADQYDAERALSQRSPTAKVRRDAHLGLILGVLGEDRLIGDVRRGMSRSYCLIRPPA
jgi:hypothetical protein